MPGGFCGKSCSYKGNDDFYTLDDTWDKILPHIPKDKQIWEAFWGDGHSGTYLQSKGLDVIHQDEDFFEHDRGDVLISNPPFSLKKTILERLFILDKPFMLIMPSEVLYYKYFEPFKTPHLTMLVPLKRIHFKTPNGDIKKFNYDCCVFCWKMDLPSQLIFI